MKTIEVVSQVTLPEDLGEFQVCERRIREAMMKAGSEMLAELFRMYEEMIVQSKRSGMKDRREKRFQTIVGEIVWKRLRVWDRRGQRLRYPLDEWLGLEGRDRGTPALQRLRAEAAVAEPYRKAQRKILEQTGVRQSVMGHWQGVQDYATKLMSQEAPVPDWQRKPLPVLDPRLATDPCPVLAIDPDGSYCHGRREADTDHDVKMAVLYTGKEPEGNTGRRWRLVNRRIYFSRRAESVQDFQSRVSQEAMAHYGAHAQTQVVIHGDGDLWIKGFKTGLWDEALLRLDPWHVKKRIREATGYTKMPASWETALYGDPDALLLKIKTFKVRYTRLGSDPREKLEALESYIANNREGLLPSGLSAAFKKQYPRMFIRGSGTIESAIGHNFADRFKRRRMSWSASGLDHLLYLKEKFVNGNAKPRYKVPQPLTRKAA